MGRISDTVGAINTTLRTLLMLVLVFVAGLFGYKGYEIYNEPREQLAAQKARLQSIEESLKQANADLAKREHEVQSLESDVAEKTAQNERLELSLRLLKVHRRIARLKVLEQREAKPGDFGPNATSPSLESTGQSSALTDQRATNNLLTRIEFVEVDSSGSALGEARQFAIRGDMVYVDYLQITFADKFIEQCDLDRSTAIVLFQRIFGEYQEPKDGFRIDTVGTRPTAYGRDKSVSDFERKIWDDFWLIANDRERAKELGIEAAQGEAVAMRVRPEMIYEIELRATGPTTIRPIDQQATN